MDQQEVDRRIESIGAKGRNPSQKGEAVVAVIMVAVIALLWRGCSSSAPRPPTMAEKDADWAAEMQLRVKAQLKDPSSAQFRSVRTYHGSGTPVVCGEVNSKNGFGGYGGFQRFVAAGDVIALEEQMAPGEMQAAWSKVCR